MRLLFFVRSNVIFSDGFVWAFCIVQPLYPFPCLLKLETLVGILYVIRDDEVILPHVPHGSEPCIQCTRVLLGVQPLSDVFTCSLYRSCLDLAICGMLRDISVGVSDAFPLNSIAIGSASSPTKSTMSFGNWSLSRFISKSRETESYVFSKSKTISYLNPRSRW